MCWVAVAGAGARVRVTLRDSLCSLGIGAPHTSLPRSTTTTTVTTISLRPAEEVGVEGRTAKDKYRKRGEKINK